MTMEEQMERIDCAVDEYYDRLRQQLINPHGKYRAWSVERDDTACEVSPQRLAYRAVLYLIRLNPYREIAKRELHFEMPVTRLLKFEDQVQAFEQRIRRGYEDWAETAKYQLRYGVAL